MKKIALFVLIQSLCFVLYPQIIRGTIMDESTGVSIPYAAVYFNGTFAGTSSDSDGYFEIDISTNLSVPLIISALGYYSSSVTDPSPDKFYRILLKPKVFELEDVIVGADGGRYSRRGRKADMRLFREVFIGETPNAKKCKILNEDDLFFSHSSRGDTLKAFSLKPLSIENEALGYKISYYLDRFEYSGRQASFYFSGNIRFMQDSTVRYRRSRRYEENREEAYTGSRMHFFRSLWNSDLDSTGFRVLDAEHNELSCNDFVIQADSLSKYLRNIGTLRILFSGKQPGSYIYFNRDSVFFNRSGNFDGSRIRWDGRMSDQRIADQLPYEYSFATDK
jgi:hypothetical protein